MNDFEAACDELNTWILQAEEAIRGMGINLKTSVPMREDVELSWQKYNNAWRLVADPTDKDLDPFPLTAAPISLRLLAVGFILKFDTYLLAAQEQELNRVKVATETLKRFVAEAVEKAETLKGRKGGSK